MMTCEVIRDLIPMYVDETASDETNEAVRSHLLQCKECNDYCRACRKAEEKNEAVFAGKNRAIKSVKEKFGEIADLDASFARLSTKLRRRRIRQIIIASAVLASLATYIVIDIVNTVKSRNK